MGTHVRDASTGRQEEHPAFYSGSARPERVSCSSIPSLLLYHIASAPGPAGKEEQPRRAAGHAGCARPV